MIDTDAVDARTWYADDDGDGYGDASSSATSCSAPTGYISNDDDCDDAHASASPAGSEICDDIDNNCDGSIDEAGATGGTAWYKDADGDGYGATSSSTTACDAPAGYVVAAGDCNDANSSFHPGALETDCSDPNDYNCDGVVGSTDADGDGWYACEECDDADASIHPDAAELCNDIDDDCDGIVDNPGTPGESTWYLDADGDGLGTESDAVEFCDAPEGYVDNAWDCDDDDPSEPIVVDRATGTDTGEGTLASPVATVQGGVDLADACVLVFAGNYYEAVDYTGKDLLVQSVEGAEATVLDATGLGSPVVTFATGESEAAILEGFTLTGGEGHPEESSETWECSSIATCTNYYTTWCGGGIYADGADPTVRSVIIEDNTLPAWSSTTSGDDTYYVYSFGGGACFVDSRATLSAFTVQRNEADGGGGLYVDRTSDVLVTQGWISSNEAREGGAMLLDEGTATWTNIASVKNLATETGGGILIADGDLFETNVTHGREGAPSGGSLLLSDTAKATLKNTIIYHTTEGEGVLADALAVFYAEYGDVYANAAGDFVGTTDPTGTRGNLAVDPLFVTVGTNAWALGSTSPCMNAGNPSPIYNDADGTRNDMGGWGGPTGDWE